MRFPIAAKWDFKIKLSHKKSLSQKFHVLIQWVIYAHKSKCETPFSCNSQYNWLSMAMNVNFMEMSRRMDFSPETYSICSYQWIIMLRAVEIGQLAETDNFHKIVCVGTCANSLWVPTFDSCHFYMWGQNGDLKDVVRSVMIIQHNNCQNLDRKFTAIKMKCEWNSKNLNVVYTL